MDNAAAERAALGIHDWLRITSVPNTASLSLIGKRLIDAGTLTVAGAYGCEFRCDGVTALDVRLKATFASGSSTTSGGSLYADRSTVLQTWTGAGAQTSTVEQALTIAALKGEKYAKVTITTTGAVVTFTTAEVLGK